MSGPRELERPKSRIAVILALVLVGIVGVSTFLPLLGPDAAVHAGIIFGDIRLPRALAASLAGFALGLSGAALQGYFRNPLADSGVLGIQSAASFGAVISLMCLPGVQPLFGAMLAAAAIALVLLLAARIGLDPLTLILIGLGTSSFFGALTALAMNLAPNPFALSELFNWLMGTVQNRDLIDILWALPLMLGGSWLLVSTRQDLDLLTIGEDAARGLGLDAPRVQQRVIFGAALLTVAAVMLAGAVGFIGLVAGHLARPLYQHRPGASLLVAGLIGGSVLALADFAIRLTPTAQEIRLGTLAALFGAPVFVMLARQLAGGQKP